MGGGNDGSVTSGGGSTPYFGQEEFLMFHRALHNHFSSVHCSHLQWLEKSVHIPILVLVVAGMRVGVVLLCCWRCVRYCDRGLWW